MSKQPPPAYFATIASAISPCPTIIQIVGRPDTGSLPRTIAPPDHPPDGRTDTQNVGGYNIIPRHFFVAEHKNLAGGRGGGGGV